MTFGVEPERPATEYGYIRPGEASRGRRFARSTKFVEKPDAATAARYVEPGYLWNTGNFMFRAAVLLDEYRSFEPTACRPSTAAVARGRHAISASSRSMPDAFGAAKANSIDYAVMEKTARAAVVPVSYGWSDVGSWHAVWELSRQGRRGQRRAGQGGVRGFAQLLRRDRQARWSRWSASTISWWSRRRTRCWSSRAEGRRRAEAAGRRS